MMKMGLKQPQRARNKASKVPGSTSRTTIYRVYLKILIKCQQNLAKQHVKAYIHGHTEKK